MKIDQLQNIARELAFAPAESKKRLRGEIERNAEHEGLFIASIARVYQGIARGIYPEFTVPAMNLRGLVFDVARAAFEAARSVAAGPIMFEIAPVELTAGSQTFDEFAGEVLAAALAEGWTGPIFLQGDHFQLESADPAALARLLESFREAIGAGFYQIDIDASEVGGRPGDGGNGQQVIAEATARIVRAVRGLPSPGGQILLGGEVGEIGGALTTAADLRAFLDAVAGGIGPETNGLGKVSVNTGTRHGGVVDENGNAAQMPVDFDLASRLGEIARREYGLPGVVQHGASTMSLAQLARLPGCRVHEVHLATALQTTIFNHPAFPQPLLRRMERELAETGARASGPETTRSPEERSASIIREHGWLAWGRFKSELWGLPESVRSELRRAVSEWLRNVFTALKLGGKGDITREAAERVRAGDRS